MIKPNQYLPLANMIIALGASVVYFCFGDIRRGMYWLSAFVLTGSVTF